MALSDEPGPKISATPCSRRSTCVGIGNDATAEDEHVAEVTIAEFFHNTREEREVCARKERQAHAIGVFLQHRFSDLFWRLMETGVDDLETVVTKGSGDGLGASVVAV